MIPINCIFERQHLCVLGLTLDQRRQRPKEEICVVFQRSMEFYLDVDTLDLMYRTTQHITHLLYRSNPTSKDSTASTKVSTEEAILSSRDEELGLGTRPSQKIDFQFQKLMIQLSRHSHEPLIRLCVYKSDNPIQILAESRTCTGDLCACFLVETNNPHYEVWEPLVELCEVHLNFASHQFHPQGEQAVAIDSREYNTFSFHTSVINVNCSRSILTTCRKACTVLSSVFQEGGLLSNTGPSQDIQQVVNQTGMPISIATRLGPQLELSNGESLDVLARYLPRKGKPQRVD